MKLRLTIHGDVQGVFFRQNARVVARRLGLKGKVRNNSDGTVSVEAVGNKSELMSLLDFCRKGPENASVEKVEEEWSKDDEEYLGFEIEH